MDRISGRVPGDRHYFASRSNGIRARGVVGGFVTGDSTTVRAISFMASPWPGDRTMRQQSSSETRGA